MKKLLSFAFFIFLTTFGMGQEMSPLLAQYSSLSGKAIPQDSLDYYNFYAAQSFEIVEGIPKEKLEGSPVLSDLKYWDGSSVEISDIQNLHPILVQLPRGNYYYAPRYVIDAEAGKVLMFSSKHTLDIHFQSYENNK